MTYTNQILYAIDNSVVTKLIDPGKTEEFFNPTRKCQFDLPNADTHFKDETLQKADISSYNHLFIGQLLKLARENDRVKRQFLEHHLKNHVVNGGSSQVFFDRILDMVSYDFKHLFTDKPILVEVVDKWINERKLSFDQKIFYDTTLGDIQSEFQCLYRLQDLKDIELDFSVILDNAFKTKYDDFHHYNSIEQFLNYHYHWYSTTFNEIKLKKDWLKRTELNIRDFIGRKSTIPAKKKHDGCQWIIIEPAKVEYGKDDKLHEYSLTWIKEKIKELNGIEALGSKTNNIEMPNTPKIVWNGQKNALTDLFHQLKNIYNEDNEPLIANSYEDLGVFLKNNFQCFESSELSTIIGQLKTSVRPKKKEKRIEIDTKKNN